MDNHALVEALSKENKTEEAAKQVSGPARAHYVEALDQLKIIIDVNSKGSEKSAKDAEEAYNKGTILAISLIAAALLAAIAFASMIIRGVTKQLGEDPGYLHHVASEVAAGQLDLRFKPYAGDGGVYGVLIKMVGNLKAKIAEADS